MLKNMALLVIKKNTFLLVLLFYLRLWNFELKYLLSNVFKVEYKLMIIYLCLTELSAEIVKLKFEKNISIIYLTKRCKLRGKITFYKTYSSAKSIKK